VNSQQPATKIRFIVIASATMMSILLYLDRFCISFAEIYIQEDLGLTNKQVAWMLSAFFWTYALGQVPSGWLTDRFGSRIMLTLYVLLWSLFTGLTGGASAFFALLLLRLGFGVGQAGAYPTASSIVSKWTPSASRGKASSIVAFGGRIGGFLALWVSGFLIVGLTPSDVRTTLESGDILSGPQLCYELAHEPAEPTEVSVQRNRCLEKFSAAGKAVVAEHAENYADKLREKVRRLKAENKSTKNVKPQVASLSDADRQILADELNRVVVTPGLFSPADMQGVSLEREATRLLARGAAERSEYDNTRLNRLVLEGLFRKGVRKIYVAGWRPMMFLYASLGLFVAAMIWWSCRTSPVEHPSCNVAEVKLISGDDGPVAGTTKSVVPIGPLLKSRSMWLSCISQWFTNIGWVFLMTWAPRYFSSVHETPIELRALLVSIPPLVGWVGMLSGGAITDLAAKKLGLRWARALPISLSRFLAMAAYLCCLLEPNVYVVVGLFAVVAFATDLGGAPTWAFTQDVGGKHVGSVLGWGNMWGNLGAAVAPVLMISIVGEGENWNYAFMACAGSFFLAGVCSIGIDASIPIAPIERKDEDRSLAGKQEPPHDP
jgi:MFS family permease